MQIKGIIFQAAVVVIGAGSGALLGFISGSLLGKLYPGGLIGFDLDPGIVGAIIMGLAGSVVGLITSAFGFGISRGAALAVLIYALLKGEPFIPTWVVPSGTSRAATSAAA